MNDPKGWDPVNNAPLRFAAQNNHSDVVIYLLENGATFNPVWDKISTEMSEFIKEQILFNEEVKSKMKRNDDFERRMKETLGVYNIEMDFEDALVRGDMPTIHEMLNEHGHRLAQDIYTLCVTIRQGHLDILKILINFLGTDFKKRGTETLLEAINCDRTNIIHFLLHDVGVNFDGDEIISRLACRGNLQYIKYFVEVKNCHVNSSSLILAAQYGHKEVVIYLLMQGAVYDPNYIQEISLEMQEFIKNFISTNALIKPAMKIT